MSRSLSNRQLALMLVVILPLAGLWWFDQAGDDGPPAKGDPAAARDTATPTPPPTATVLPPRPAAVAATPAERGSSARASRRDGAPAAGGAGDSQPADAGKPPSANPLAAILIDKLNATIERPLFEPSRQAYKPPPPPPQQAPRKPPPPPRPPPPDPTHFSLQGIVTGPSRNIATLKRKATGRSLQAEVGDVVDGWKFEKVEAVQVVISKDGTQVILRLNRRPAT